MIQYLGGPMFESAEDADMKSVHAKRFAEAALRQWCPNESSSGKLAAAHAEAIAKAILAAEGAEE